MLCSYNIEGIAVHNNYLFLSPKKGLPPLIKASFFFFFFQVFFQVFFKYPMFQFIRMLTWDVGSLRPTIMDRHVSTPFLDLNSSLLRPPRQHAFDCFFFFDCHHLSFASCSCLLVFLQEEKKRMEEYQWTPCYNRTYGPRYQARPPLGDVSDEETDSEGWFCVV